MLDVDSKPECLPWWGPIRVDGYGRTRGRHRVLAHRHIYEECFGMIPDGLVVRHKCDNPGCVAPEHLDLGTQADNMRDMVERRRSAMRGRFGDAHPKTVLSDDGVRRAFELRSEGFKQREIAAELGCSRSLISNVLRGTRHVGRRSPSPDPQR